MALYDPLTQDSPEDARPGRDQSVGVTDIGKEAAAGAFGLAASAASTYQYGAEQLDRIGGDTGDDAKISRGLSKIYGYGRDAIRDTESEAAQDARAHPWDHKFGYLGLQAAGLAPAVAAFAIFPEGLISEAIAGGAFQTSQVIDGVVGRTNEMTDDELADASPVFKQFLDDGDDPEVARAKLHHLQLGGATLLESALVGAATGGILGRAVRGAGLGTGGRLSRAALGAGEGALAGGVSAAQSEYAIQAGDVAAGMRQTIDYADIADNAALAAVTFGVGGGAFGALTGRRAPKENRVQEIASIGPDPDMHSAITATNPLPEGAQKPEVATTAPQAPTAPAAPVAPVPTPAEATAPTPPVPAPGVGPEINEPAVPGDGTIVPRPKGWKKGTEAWAQPAPEVTSVGNSPTVPERPETIEIQIEQLKAGKRAVVMLPAGRAMKDSLRRAELTPEGFKRVKTGKGDFVYDPAKITEATIRQKVKEGRENEILELGPFNKEDVSASAATGAPEVGVVERTATGTEVRAAAGTTETAPEQIAAMAPGVDGGNTLAVEPAAETLARRADPEPLPAPIEPAKERAKAEAARPPRVLKDRTAPDAVLPVHKVPGVTPEAPKRSHKGLHADAKREQDAIAAKNLFKEKVPETEVIPQTLAEKNALWERLNDIVTSAKELDIHIPTKVGYEGTSDHLVYLRDAQQMRDKLAKGTASDEQIHTFLMDERSAKEGDFKPLRDRRKLEGDLMFRRDQGDVEGMTDKSAGAEATAVQTPEDALAAKQEEEQAPAFKSEEEAFAAGKERAPPKIEGHVAIAGKDKTGSGVKVEVRGKGRTKTRLMKTEDLNAKDPVPGILHASNVRDVMGDMDFTRIGNGVNRSLANKIANRFRNTIGDVPVHVISTKDMNALFDERFHNKVSGFYDYKARKIVIDERLVKDGKIDANVMLHESAHAALEYAIERDPEMRHALTKMLETSKAFLDEELVGNDRYGFTDIHEFVSEALSNPAFQNALMSIPMPKSVAKMLDFKRRGDWQRPSEALSMWDAMIQVVRKFVFRMSSDYGTPKIEHTMLEGVLRAVDEMETWTTAQHRGLGMKLEPMSQVIERAKTYEESLAQAANVLKDYEGTTRALIEDPMARVQKFAQAVAEDARSTSNLKRWGFKFLTNKNLQGMYEKLYPEGTFRAVNENMERTDHLAHELAKPGDSLTRDMVVASKQHPKEWGEYQQLLQDSRYYSAHADKAANDPLNKHLARDEFAQGSSKHGDLSARYNALPAPLKALYRRTVDFYSGAHADFAKRLVDKLFEGHAFASGTDVAGIKRRLHDGTLTAADRTAMDAAMGKGKAEALSDMAELRKVEGPYVPLSRRGDFVVQAKHSIATPDGATRTKNGQPNPDGNTFEFTDVGKMRTFLKNLPIVGRVEKLYFDPNTGKKIGAAEAADKALYPQGVDERFRVKIDPSHVEFHETQTAARASREGLEANTRFNDVRVERRRDASPMGDTELSSPQVQALVRALQKDTRLSAAAREAAIRDLNDTSLALQQGNRIMKHQIKAEKISGADEDIIRNTLDYNLANSRARARMEFEPVIDKNMKAMKSRTKLANDNQSLLRSDVMREMEDRLYSNYRPDSKGKYTQFMQKLMTVSFLKRMASPAHLLIHMTHPWMISMPVIGARHGFGRASSALIRAYNDMGATGALGMGVKGFKRMARNIAADPTNFINYFKGNLSGAPDSARLGRMLDELTKLNLVHPDAGMEVHRMVPGRGKVSAALDRVDGAMRELSAATESINRVAEAVAAYRLEFTRTGNHGGAVRYAGDTLANSQGLYSRSNAAPLFRNPVFKPFLQFKQFPQMMYHLLARNLYQAFKGETREVRMEALRQFAGVVGTHALMSGALGLPLEIFKVPVMLAHAFGFTSLTWEDLEEGAQHLAADKLGGGVGEVLMHGLPRVLGPFSVDLHHRLGLSALLTFGEPEGDKASDTLNYLTTFLAGAPGSMAVDTLNGSKAIMDGEFTKGAQLLLPVKAFADIAKAGKYAVQGGKTDSKGNLQPYSVPELLTTALGFKPGPQANYDAARSSVFNELKKEKAAKADRRSLIDAWVKSKGGEKSKAFKAVQDYNKTASRDAQIPMSALTKALAASRTEGTTLGFRETKRNKEMLDEAKRIHNVN